MKGGKPEKSRRPTAVKHTSARAVAKNTKPGERPINSAPSKGSKKRPDSGGMSRSGEY